MAKVGIFGAGWVGLVTGACFAELGHEVVIRDVVAAKIDALRRGEVPFHEDRVPALLERNRDRLTFTLDPADVADCEFLFVCVDTPPTHSGDADLSKVWTVVEELPALEGRPVLVMKSTVPVGTGEKVRHGLDSRGLRQVGYASNPEFLAEGNAVHDFMNPDRIVVGAFEPEDAEAVAGLYERIEAPIVRCDVNSAEMIKLAANAFLMTRISFINEIANVCEATGADVVQVAKGIGLDHRLGPHFLRAGIGYGGSCLRGEEAVGICEGEDMRTTTLARLFDHVAEGDTEAEVVQPLGLEVFAWDPETCNPGFFPVAAITRRWFEGDLLGVKHGLYRGVRATPDHPFVVAAEAGGPTAVKPAAELTTDDWLPFVQTWRNKRVQQPRHVAALASAGSGSLAAGGGSLAAGGGSLAAGGLALATEDVIESAAVDWIPTDWARVVSITPYPYEGYVYSLEVPGVHTFVTTAGLVTHNCFPKDSLALKQLASNSGYHFHLLSAVIEVNELQKRRVIGKLKRHLGSLRGKRVALLGLAFKPDTDDMREAPSIVLASRLLAEGADVSAWDPVADGGELPKGVDIASSVLEAVQGADAAVIVTEWAELKELAREEVRAAMAHPLIVDGRNLLDPEAARAAGFAYEGIGRPSSPSDVLTSDVLPTTAEREPQLEHPHFER